MTRKYTGRLSWLAIVALSVALAFPLAQRLSGGSSRTSEGKERSEVISLEAGKPGRGIVGWLEGVWGGLRFQSVREGSHTPPEVLATAHCLRTGEKISCNGFASLEEYVAAARVAEKLGIPFEKLQERIRRGATLRQAIRELRPEVNSHAEAMRAEQHARQILNAFSS